ncbi:MAG: hypothetical protein JOZ44_09315 [Acidobacteria bacterium]|nr:hypothetical protein [Acidobacteriota bacterium]
MGGVVPDAKQDSCSQHIENEIAPEDRVLPENTATQHVNGHEQLNHSRAEPKNILQRPMHRVRNDTSDVQGKSKNVLTVNS